MGGVGGTIGHFLQVGCCEVLKQAPDLGARAISWLLHKRVFKEGSEPAHNSGSSHGVGLYLTRGGLGF